MNKELENLINKFKNIFDMRSDEFTDTNGLGDVLDASDYCDKIVPIRRAKSDLNKMLDILKEGNRILEKDDFYVLIAAFCNYYIEEGLNIVFKKKREFGLTPFFTSGDDKDIVYCIFKGIKTQNYYWFKRAYELDNNCTVAKVYLCVRAISKLMNAITTKENIEDELEDRAWKYYEELDAYWRDYIIRDKEDIYIQIQDKSPLPYILCTSRRENALQDIICSSEYILDKLDIDIDKLEPDKLLNTIGFKLKNISKENMYPVWYGIQELCENIGELLKSTDETSTYEFENIKYFYHSRRQFWRYNFLHIPFFQDNITTTKNVILNRYKIFAKNRELNKKNTELEIRNKKIEDLNKEREDMMNYYAHSWKHIAYPEIVKSVAEELMNTDISLASRLMKAYNSEKTLQHGIVLLQLVNSGVDSAVRNRFMRGFSRYGRDAVGVVNINMLIEQSLDIVVFKMLMKDSDESTAISQCRKQIDIYHSLNDCIDDYTNMFISKRHDKDINIIEWTSNNIMEINVTINEEWDGVRVMKESFSASTLVEIFVEIFTNTFMHGRDYCELDLISTDDALEIISLNKKGIYNPGTGQGIGNMQSLMDKININTDIKGLYLESNDNLYKICLQFDKKLMIKRGR